MTHFKKDTKGVKHFKKKSLTLNYFIGIQDINLHDFYGVFPLAVRDARTLALQSMLSGRCVFQTQDLIGEVTERLSTRKILASNASLLVVFLTAGQVQGSNPDEWLQKRLEGLKYQMISQVLMISGPEQIGFSHICRVSFYPPFCLEGRAPNGV